MNLIKSGTTSKLDCVYITTLSTGAALTGATYSGVTISYFLSTGSTVTHASAVTMTLGTWVTLGFVQVDATNFPGLYQIGVPNGVFATASTNGFLSITGISGQAPCVVKYEVTGSDINDGVRLGLTALPNIAIGTTGQLATGNASGQTTVATNGDKTGYSLATAPPTAAAIATAVAADILITPSHPLATDASGYVTTTGGGGGGPTLSQILSGILDNPAVPLQTDGAGHVNAAVVLGAVASVAGNVGGSIAGTVSGVVNGVTLDMTAAVPRTNTAETVGDSLHAARASGFGALIVNPTALTETLYESDGSTVAKAWNIDSATAPTQRI